MSKQKKPTPAKRRNNQIRISWPLLRRLEILAKQRGVERSVEAEIAIREYLERFKMWPPSVDLGGLPDECRPAMIAYLKERGLWTPEEE